MRIALLLSGQPRFIEEGSEYILKNICEGNNVDTFTHFWMDDGLITKPYKFGGAGGWVNQRIDSKAVDKAFEIYRPVTSIVEPSNLLMILKFLLRFQRISIGVVENQKIRRDLEIELLIIVYLISIV